MSIAKRLILAASALVTAVGLATPAFAAKSTVSGTIELNGGFSSTSGGATWYPSYGDTATFNTTVNGRLSSKSRVYVTVVCTQGSTVVYQASADPDSSFRLVDQAGQGLDWNGSAATCSATLVYRVEQGKNITINYLDNTEFPVSG